MPEYAVFSVDADAGRVENVEATSEREAEAIVQAKYPGATTSVVSADAVEGCNRTLVLWEWMAMLEREKR